MRSIVFTFNINRTLQGRPFHILLTVTLPQEESEFKNRLAVIIDITERKRMEDEILKVQKLESLSILAGGIAHDFNNVLTGILGSISLAKMRTPSDDTMLKTLTEAEKGCFRARELTQQLITLRCENIQLNDEAVLSPNPIPLRNSAEW